MLAISSLTEVGVGLAAALVISLVSSWALALVVIAFIPLLLLGGLVQVWLLRSRVSTESASSQVHTYLVWRGYTLEQREGVASSLTAICRDDVIPCPKMLMLVTLIYEEVS
jgi:hypothetical protein